MAISLCSRSFSVTEASSETIDSVMRSNDCAIDPSWLCGFMRMRYEKSPRSTARVPFSIRFTAREIEKISTAAKAVATK
jgi:hypothetical protein